MMDRDPERLSKAAANGCAGELLRAAEEEVAPAAVRERVLSAIASALARAGENTASVPLSTLSGVFERRDEGASGECEAGAAGGGVLAVLRASSAAGGALGRTGSSCPESVSGALQLSIRLRAERALCSVWGARGEGRSAFRHDAPPAHSGQLGIVALDTASASRWRATRLGETRRGLRVSPSSTWQLAAAVVAGVVLAKGLLWAAEGMASGSEAAATRVAPSVATTVAPRVPHSVTVPRREPASAVPATVSAASVSPVAEPDGAISPRSVTREAESPKQARSPQAESREAFVPNVGGRRGRRCAAGCTSPQHAARNPSSRVTAPAAYVEGAIPSVEYDDDDWLGEQLALLSRAERRLLAGNPGDALRSLDEYRARFPRGLLDPQIAALQERAQRSVESFTFP